MSEIYYLDQDDRYDSYVDVDETVVHINDGFSGDNFVLAINEAEQLYQALDEEFGDKDDDDVEWRCLCGEVWDDGSHDCDCGQGSEEDVSNMKTPMENNDRSHDHLVTMKDVERTVNDLQAQINVLHAFYEEGDDE